MEQLKVIKKTYNNFHVASEEIKKCPYDLSQFTKIANKNKGRKTISSEPAYFRITRNENKPIQVFLSLSYDLSMQLINLYKTSHYSLGFNQHNELMMLIPDKDGNKLNQHQRGKGNRARNDIAFGKAREELFKRFGTEIKRVFLDVDVYQDCVILRPTGKVVRY